MPEILKEPMTASRIVCPAIKKTTVIKAPVKFYPMNVSRMLSCVKFKIIWKKDLTNHCFAMKIMIHFKLLQVYKLQKSIEKLKELEFIHQTRIVCVLVVG